MVIFLIFLYNNFGMNLLTMFNKAGRLVNTFDLCNFKIFFDLSQPRRRTQVAGGKDAWENLRKGFDCNGC